MIRVLIYIFFTVMSTTAHSMTLNTKSFTIDIKNNCAEGEVTCDNISYTGIRKSDGARINLVGHTLNKKNTLDLYGYEFKNGNYTYSIYIQRSEFTLQKNGNVIFFEAGKWSDTVKTEKNDNDINCKLLNFNNPKRDIDDYRSGEVCFFKNKKILDAYSQYRINNINNENGKYLEKLPIASTDKNKIIIQNTVEIKYNWKNEKELNIDVIFSGGVTHLIFKEFNDGTKISTVYDPD